MQIPVGIAIGIGLFGFVPVATIDRLAQGVSPVASGVMGEERPITDDTQIIVIEGVHRWYNLAWSDLLGFDGEWEEIETEDGAIFRPLSDECSVAVRPLWKDQIAYFRVPEDGGVEIHRGWLEIDQTSWSEPRGGSLRPASSGSFQQSCDRRFDAGSVCELDESGGCWANSGSSECETSKVCSSVSGDGCTLELLVSEGMRVMVHTFDGDCGAELSYSRCVDPNGAGSICVNFAQ